MTFPSDDLAIYRELKKILTSIGDVNVLSFGDWVLDVYVEGDIERISREAPIPILRWKSEKNLPGGACNVAANLASLGAKVTAIGVIGKDKEGKTLKDLLISYKVNPESIEDEGRYTTVKTRFLGASQQMFRFDREQNTDFLPALRKKLLAKAKELVKKCDIAVVSDYGNKILDGGVCEEFISFAKAQGKKVLVDPRSRNFSRYQGADMVTPNLRELAVSANVNLDDAPVEEVVAEARKLCAKHKISTMLVTRGAKGLSYISKDIAIHQEANKRNVFDVTGAGDCVAAVAALGIVNNLEPAAIARISNYAGSLAVQALGVVVLQPHQFTEKTDFDNKVLNLEELIKITKDWHSEGLTIGLTNGCFDLLHAGHISQLQFAASKCDKLIVAINSDSSVKKLKGSNRPLQDHGSRAMILSSLSLIDKVIIFNEENANLIVKAIKPNIYIKGGEYKDKKFIESETIKKQKGSVLFAPMLQGFSTSLLADKIKNKA